jgi:TRAF3-interacting protein 1
MGDVPAWVTETKNLLQPLIKKPTLKEDLLQKPPFRFIHDIVTNLSSSTNGFASKIIEADQLDPANVSVS